MNTNEYMMERFENQTNLSLETYKNRGILKKEIRSYEVSLWTLQDSFITVLKWSDAEQKGRIEKPKMILNIDGTEKFTFSIPMYIFVNGEFIENPNWYNTRNGNIMPESMRKIKVTFNKEESIDTYGTLNDNIFEFLITSVKEIHENNVLTCEVECEGLAFQELGKIGYAIELSSDNFAETYNIWSTEGKWFDHNNLERTEEPLETLNYWCEEWCDLLPYPNTINDIDPNRWYYTLQMNQRSSKDGIGGNRYNYKIYEEPYVNAWNIIEDENTNKFSIQSKNVASWREKTRGINIDKSNLYNITQELAKTFQVFCRYAYIHNNNQQIIGKVVIFYNNFIKEEDGVLSVSYPYNSNKITRHIDGNSLTTKLFVLDASDENTIAGYSSITSSPANLSLENYILNFEYLHDIKAITDEQYNEVEQYNLQMRKINQELTVLQQQKATYELQKPEIEAKQAIAERSIKIDQEQIGQNSALANSLDGKDGVQDGYITVSSKNPDYLIILTDDAGQKYINLKNTNKGIKESTIQIFTNRNGSELSGSITNFQCVHDPYGNLESLKLLNSSLTGSVFLTYDYSPKLYYDNIVKQWKIKLNNDTKESEEQSQLLTMVNEQIDNITSNINIILANKKAIMRRFEAFMGPAIREGYWQPEDYDDYGDHYLYQGPLTTNDITADSALNPIIAWDSLLFDTEDKLYYQVGINAEEEYYPCINLNTVFSNNIPSELSSYSLVWNDVQASSDNDVAHLKIMAIGSDALIKFVKQNNNIIPILVVTGAKTLSQDSITRMKSSEAKARLVKISTSINNDTVTINQSNREDIDNSAWMTNIEENYEIVYPRIKFSSLNLKTDTNNLTIKYDNKILDAFKDYYLLSRNTLRDSLYYPEYYITVKPEVLIQNGYNENKQFQINYVFSNASTSIYLDAKKISEENAKPKVSYEIDINLINPNLSRELYNKLAQIIIINDVDLKFNEVFGYISQLELDLDQCQNDKIEIKNYTTKFEDLFSTIIAQTEAMKQNSGNLSLALNGDAPLSDEGLNTTLDNNSLILQAYLDSYFDSSQVVRDRLQELFSEVGEILASSNKSLNAVHSLSLKNAEILGSFVQDVASELTPKVYTSTSKPVSFKPGDIWFEPLGDGNYNRYVATYDSNMLSSSGTSLSTGGFVRTHDGTLASITGAGMDIDAEKGLIDIYAQSEIKLRSGNHLYVAADDTVDIVGNKQVNIGGGSVNIAGDATNNNVAGGVHIVSSKINFNQEDTNIENAINNAIASTSNSISKVLIDPDKIEMGGANIIMKGANKIQMITSRNSLQSTSALSISPSEGVWIGSGAGVKLYSGNISVTQNADGTLTPVNGTGASVELLPTHLLFGVSNTTGSTTAVEMTDNYIVIAAGDQSRSKNITGVTNGLIGAKFTKNSIGMAVQTGTGQNIVTTALLMDKNGFTVGSGGIDVTTNSLRDIANGSYTRINKDGIELGSLADLYINTDNFKLQTHSRDKNNTNYTDGDTLLAIGRGLQHIAYDTTMSALQTLNDNNTADIRLVLNKNGAYLKGDVYARSFIAPGGSYYFKANSSQLGFYNNNNGILTIDANGYIQANNKLYIAANSSITMMSDASNSAVTIDQYGITIASSKKLVVNTDNVKIDPTATTTNAIFYAGDAAGTKFIKYSQSGGLQVTGAITATSLTVGNGTYLNYDSSNGLNIGNGGLTYTSSGGLNVSGAITANSGMIGQWRVGDALRNYYYSGTTLYRDTVQVNGILTGGVQTSRVVLIGANNHQKLTDWALYAGAEWPEDAPYYSKYQTPGPLNPDSNIKAIGWAPFRVKTNGETYIKNLCIGNGPSDLPANELSYEAWTGYEGKMWFWVAGTDEGGTKCFRWISIDGQQLYDLLEDVHTLWIKVFESGKPKSADTNTTQAVEGVGENLVKGIVSQVGSTVKRFFSSAILSL